jgi:cell division protein FtsB
MSTAVLWFAPEGIPDLRKREAEVRQAQSRLLSLEKRNLELFDEVKRLARKDPEVMEGLARRRGLARPGETVYTFKDRGENP